MPIENIKNKESDEKKEKKEEERKLYQETLLLKRNIKIGKIISDIRFFKHLSLLNWYSPLNNETKKENSDIKDKQNFINYVIKWKLWSWEDPEMEEIYRQLVYLYLEQNNYSWANNTSNRTMWRLDNTKPTRPEARRLKYIMDNREKNIDIIIKEIEEIEEKKAEEKKEKTNSNTTRPITKKEIDLIPQSLKNLINKWYTYMVKWKELIVKEASGAIKNIWEFVGWIFRFFIDFAKIKSSPSERNPKTGVTQCSKTAQKNAIFFWINIPSWNAKEWVHKPIVDKEHFVSTKTKLWNNNSYIDINLAAPNAANLADISVESDTINWRKYWHRAIAFKNNDGQRYVLDPYYSWWYGTKPIPRNKYPKHTVTEQINFYNAPKQSVSA